MTDAEAVRQRVLAAATSFYWGMRRLPEARRRAMFAIYAFCREVDDIADEGGDMATKTAGLATWRAEIDQVFGGTPAGPIGRELRLAQERFGMAREHFLAVIDGMEMDAVADIRAPDEPTLDLYVSRVACAVGHLSVAAFGTPQPDGAALSEALGRALQLSNILRDLREDAARGRLYLPREVLERQGITASSTGGFDPETVLVAPGLPAVAAEIGARARGHFTEARAIMDRCPRATVRPSRMMMEVYRRVLDRLESRGWDRVLEPVSLPKPLKLWVAFRYGIL